MACLDSSLPHCTLCTNKDSLLSPFALTFSVTRIFTRSHLLVIFGATFTFTFTRGQFHHHITAKKLIFVHTFGITFGATFTFTFTGGQFYQHFTAISSKWFVTFLNWSTPPFTNTDSLLSLFYAPLTSQLHRHFAFVFCVKLAFVFEITFTISFTSSQIQQHFVITFGSTVAFTIVVTCTFIGSQLHQHFKCPVLSNDKDISTLTVNVTFTSSQFHPHFIAIGLIEPTCSITFAFTRGQSHQHFVITFGIINTFTCASPFGVTSTFTGSQLHQQFAVTFALIRSKLHKHFTITGSFESIFEPLLAFTFGVSFTFNGTFTRSQFHQQFVFIFNITFTFTSSQLQQHFAFTFNIILTFTRSQLQQHFDSYHYLPYNFLKTFCSSSTFSTGSGCALRCARKKKV